MRYELHLGDNREVLRSMPSDSVDSIVCDPPYELGFMGKKWDSTGSGATGCAAMLEGVNFIGIDITPEYKDIAERRIQYWASQNPMGLSS